MDAATFMALALACAPDVHVETARALVKVESSMNAWAIGVVGGALRRQPNSKREALITAASLQAAGKTFSVGLAQINVRNFKRLGLTLDKAFEPCANLAAMQMVLSDCFAGASKAFRPGQPALRSALSCYYSGDFETGFRHGYVQKVARAAYGMQRPSLRPSKEKP